MSGAMFMHPVRFMSDHRFTRAHASDYLDGALGVAARARIDQHTHVCPACLRFLDSLRRTVAALHSLLALPLPVPSAVGERALARLRGVPDAGPTCGAEGAPPGLPYPAGDDAIRPRRP